MTDISRTTNLPSVKPTRRAVVGAMLTCASAAAGATGALSVGGSTMNMISPITPAQAAEARPVEDAEMERVWAELVRRYVAYYGFDRLHYDTNDEADRAFDAAGNAFWEHVRKLASTPARTVFGVAVKLAVVYMVEEGQPEDPDMLERMAWSAFRDACVACGRDLIGEVDQALAAAG